VPALTDHFCVEAIPASALRRIRAAGRDDQGNPLRISVAQEAGAPLRCCLREAAIGERLALIAWRPFDRDGPYAEVGPVFVHAEECPGYGSPSAYPEGYRHRRQVFRPYDHDGDMVYDALEIVEGADAEAAIARILARRDVAVIHSRNLLAGCYMFSIRRAHDARRDAASSGGSDLAVIADAH
jgi:Protein of unknown function (DUF1203)